MCNNLRKMMISVRTNTMNKIVLRTCYFTAAIVVGVSVAQPVLLKVLPGLGGVAYAFSGGDGSSGNPYQVSTCDDLESIATGDPSVNYVLTQDIDCSGVNGGTGFIPIGGFNTSQFKGVLDGQNFTVSNITIDAAEQTYAGMFGVVESATIKNLKLDHTTINSAYYSVGTLAGFMSYTTVSHVSSTNFVINESNSGWDVGGLVGLYGSGDGGVTLNTMDGAAAQGTINSSVVGGAAYGGLIGELDYDTVTNSYADVTIGAAGVQRAGGAGWL